MAGGKRKFSGPTGPQGPAGDLSDQEGPKKKRKKITFQDVTVYHFKRRQGFVCIPSQGGNTLGMKDSHFSVEVFTMDEFASAKRAELAKAWAHSLGESEASDDSEAGVAREAIHVPIDMEEDPAGLLLQVDSKERRAVLRRAGVHEIDPSEKEQCRSLRGSRQDCGCTCQVYCLPDTCACAIEGIKCQVDRPGFPCACTKDGCQNQAGRLEFNPVKVRTHFVRTIMRTRLENAKYLEPPPSKYLEHTPISKYIEPSTSKYLEHSTSKYLEPSSSKYLGPSSSMYLEPSSSKYLEPSSSKYIETPSTSYIDPSLTPQVGGYIGTYQGQGGVYGPAGAHLVEEGYYPTEWTGWEAPEKWWTLENGEIRSRQDPMYHECPLGSGHQGEEVDSSAVETDGESSSDSEENNDNVEEDVGEDILEYPGRDEYKEQESEYSGSSYVNEDLRMSSSQESEYTNRDIRINTRQDSEYITENVAMSTRQDSEYITEDLAVRTRPDSKYITEDLAISTRQDSEYVSKDLPMSTRQEMDFNNEDLSMSTRQESEYMSEDLKMSTRQESDYNNEDLAISLRQENEYISENLMMSTRQESEYSNTSYSSEDIGDNEYLSQEAQDNHYGKEAQFSDDSQYSETNQFSQDTNVDTNLSDISSILTSSLIESVHA